MRIVFVCSMVLLLSFGMGCTRTPPPKEKPPGPTSEELDKANANLPPGQSIAR